MMRFALKLKKTYVRHEHSIWLPDVYFSHGTKARWLYSERYNVYQNDCGQHGSARTFVAVNPCLLQPLWSIPLPNGFCGLVGQIPLVVCKVCIVQFLFIYYPEI